MAGWGVVVFIAGSVSAACLHHFLTPPRIERLPVATDWPSIPQQGSTPDFDALAIAIAAQNNSIAFGASVLAVIVLLTGVVWTFVVVSKAQQEAQKAAIGHLEKVGPDLLNDWLEKNLPRYVRDLKEMKSDDVDGDAQPDFDATLMGKYADETPQGQSDDH